MISQAEHRKGRILYVDDEELACKYFQRSAGNDYEVIVVNSANEAIALLQQKNAHIGVIVTDYRMPSRDGGDLLRQIQREFPSLVRILVTAYADKNLLLDTVNSGEVFRILEKPIDIAEVRKVLRLAVDVAHERLANRQRLSAINETLAFLAHELNTPLATIVNYGRGITQRMQDKMGVSHAPEEEKDAEMRQAVQAMHDNARYCLSVLSSFIDSVRNVSVEYAGNASSASRLLATLLDTYPLSGAQREMIKVHIRQDFLITAIPNCVVLVMSSLISNALRALQSQAVPQLSITIDVSSHGEQEVEIADNGPGIPQHILEHLMIDPITTYAKAGGSGRGMIFCNRIMQSFGGALKVESEAGRSTTVTLRFPIAKSVLMRNV
jgi:two-component system response regulator PhcR